MNFDPLHENKLNVQKKKKRKKHVVRINVLRIRKKFVDPKKFIYAKVPSHKVMAWKGNQTDKLTN